MTAWLVWLSGCFVYKGGPADTGATEPCDRTTTTALYEDADGDGAGDPARPLDACASADGAVADASDCDDADAAVRPGAAEICDGRDNDCDPETLEAGAAFVGAAGGAVDLGPVLAGGAPGAPVPLLFPDPGTVYLCPGDWHASLRIEGDVDVVGVGGSLATALHGGDVLPGIVVEGPRQVTVRGVSIDGAAALEIGAVEVGGALACSGSATVTASDLQLVGGTVLDAVRLGGIVSVREGCAVEIADSTFIDGAAVYGGQIYVENASLTLDTVDLLGGYAVGGGSAFIGNFLAYYAYGPSTQVATLTCTDCSFTDHTAGAYYGPEDANGVGGAIVTFGDALVTLNGGTFYDNSAGRGGGAVALFPTNVALDPTLPRVDFVEVSFSGNLGANVADDVYIGTDPPAIFTFDPGPQTVGCGPETCL